MERFRNQVLKIGILIGIPIVSLTIIGSLLYYIKIWYVNQKVLIINEANISMYLVFIGAILISSFVNLGFLFYYSRSLKRIEKLSKENCVLSELVLQQNFKTKDELLEAISKVGAKVD